MFIKEGKGIAVKDGWGKSSLRGLGGGFRRVGLKRGGGLRARGGCARLGCGLRTHSGRCAWIGGELRVRGSGCACSEFSAAANPDLPSTASVNHGP